MTPIHLPDLKYKIKSKQVTAQQLWAFKNELKLHFFCYCFLVLLISLLQPSTRGCLKCCGITLRDIWHVLIWITQSKATNQTPKKSVFSSTLYQHIKTLKYNSKIRIYYCFNTTLDMIKLSMFIQRGCKK